MRKEALALVTAASMLTGCSAVGMERTSESVETVTTTVTVNPTPEETNPTPELNGPEITSTPTETLGGLYGDPEASDPPLGLYPTDTPTIVPMQPVNPNKKSNVMKPISERTLGEFVLFVVEHGRKDGANANRWIYTLDTKSGPVTEYVTVDPKNHTKATAITIEHGKPRIGIDSGVEPMAYTTSSKNRKFTDGFERASYDRGFYAGEVPVADGKVDKFSGYGFGYSAKPLHKTAELVNPKVQDTSFPAQSAQRDYFNTVTQTLEQ